MGTLSMVIPAEMLPKADPKALQANMAASTLKFTPSSRARSRMVGPNTTNAAPYTHSTYSMKNNNKHNNNSEEKHL